MSLRNFLFVTMMTFSCSFAFGQNLFSSGAGGTMLYLKPMSGGAPAGLKRGSFVGQHLLGDSVTQKLNLFEKSYVYYKTSNGAYPVEERVVLKRNLYKKIKDFDEFITKSYVTKVVERDSAQMRLAKVLDIGTKLMRYDTHQVEKDVKKLAVPTEFERYLTNLKFQ